MMRVQGLIIAIALFGMLGCKCASPRVTIRGQKSELCKRAQQDLTRCSSQRSNDMLKTCAKQLERVHRECPQR